MSWVRLAALSELSPGRGRLVVLEGRRLAAFLLDGEVHVIDDACPHRGASLSNGRVVGRVVECPLHLWAFDLTTGRMRGAGVAIARYPVELRDGEVYVALQST